MTPDLDLLVRVLHFMQHLPGCSHAPDKRYRVGETIAACSCGLIEDGERLIRAFGVTEHDREFLRVMYQSGFTK